MARLLATCCLLAILLIPLAGSASARVDYPMFATPTPLNRLVEDPWRGGIWLGSDIGLVLLPSAGGPPEQVSFRQGLPGSNVYDIAVTPDRVWVGTNLGPAVYNKGDGTVSPILGPDGAPINDESRSVYAGPDGVWLGTNHEGLFHVDSATLRATPVENPVNHSAWGNPILGIGADGQEMFITATGYGLVDWHRDTGQASLHDTHLLGSRPLYGRLIVNPDRVWVATSGDGVVYLDRAADRMGENASPKTSNALQIAGLSQAGQETWFGTQSGISRRDGATGAWRNWQNMPWGSANDVAMVQGVVYAAMNRGYVIAYDRAHDTWLNVPWWTTTSAPDQNTFVACDTLDGKPLFGTGGAGALTYDPQSHEWHALGTVQRGPPDILVWNIAQDGQKVWFATQRGAGRWDRSTDQWTNYRTDGRTNISFANSVHQVAPSPDGAWFATQSYQPPQAVYRGVGWQRGSLAHWQEAIGQWTYYRTEQGLANDNVTGVVLTPGSVWAGMLGGGLDRLDLPTNHIVHVYPTDGSKDTVNVMRAQGDTLWFGTSHGLWHLDVATGQPQEVPGTDAFTILSIAFDGGKVWAGTAGAGIFSLDPATGAMQPYRAAGVMDIWAYCLERVGDLLYVGTGQGLERLDVGTGTWYPQMGPYVLSGIPVPASVAITRPAEGAKVPAGSLLELEGTARAPDGAVVQVRVGSGPWLDMEGTTSWHGQVQLANQTQDTTINIRLLVGGSTRAQTARSISLASPDGLVATLGARHLPILEATEGDSITFNVTVDGSVAGAVVLTLPGNGTALRLPLAEAGGAWTATSPPLEPAGPARYHIELTSDRGSQVLPDPYEGYGAEYPLTIRPAGSFGAFAAAPQCPPTFAPGGAATVSMVVQNTGVRAANLSLVLSGPGAAWATAPAPHVVDPAGSWQVTIPVQAPAGAQAGTYKLDGTVAAGQATLDHFSCTFQLASKGFLGIPAPAAAILLVALGLAARVRRRDA